MLLQEKFGNYLLKILPIFNFSIFKKELSVNVPANKITQIFTFFKLHTNTQYKVLSDMCVVDYIGRNKRFEVIYNLLSIRYNSRLIVKITLGELDYVESLTKLYANSNWYERESWDMFGIFIFNHPDLRRILTDYGFDGHPLRKDFPLSGFLEVYFDEFKKGIVYKQLNLAQQYRTFDFKSPWFIN